MCVWGLYKPEIIIFISTSVLPCRVNTRRVLPCRVNTRLAAASDKIYELLAHGRWFSPGTPASSTTKIGRHDIAEILLKVALSTMNESIKPICHAVIEKLNC